MYIFAERRRSFGLYGRAGMEKGVSGMEIGVFWSTDAGSGTEYLQRNTHPVEVLELLCICFAQDDGIGMDQGCRVRRCVCRR